MRRRMMKLKDGMLVPVFKNESNVCESEACGVCEGEACGVCENIMTGEMLQLCFRVYLFRYPFVLRSFVCSV